jgi:hypothetical protein
LISKISTDARRLLCNYLDYRDKLPAFASCEATSRSIQNLTAQQLQMVFRKDSEVTQSGIVKRAENSSSGWTADKRVDKTAMLAIA